MLFLSHPPPQLHYELPLVSPTNSWSAALALIQSLFIQKHPSSSLPRITTFPTMRGGECQHKRWVDTSKSNIGIAGTLYQS